MIFELSAVVFSLIVLGWLSGQEAQLHDLKAEVGLLRNKVKKLEAITSYPEGKSPSTVTCPRCNGFGTICTDKAQHHFKKCEVCLGACVIDRSMDH